MEDERLYRLLERRDQLLLEQASLSRELNEWLTCKGDGDANDDGAIENSRKTMKNLEAAIVQAKNPGYFEYHRKSRKVREMEKKGVLKKLAIEICQLEDKLTAVKKEIVEIDHARKNRVQQTLVSAPPVSGFKEWFARYGEPSQALRSVQGLSSEFVPNPKVYGGTKHHKAFKTLSVTLRKGRITR